MAPKGVQSRQWRAALDTVVAHIEKMLMRDNLADDTPDDEKFMDAGIYFQQKYPSQESKQSFYARLREWLASLGANVEYAIQAVRSASPSEVQHF